MDVPAGKEYATRAAFRPGQACSWSIPTKGRILDDADRQARGPFCAPLHRTGKWLRKNVFEFESVSRLPRHMIRSYGRSEAACRSTTRVWLSADEEHPRHDRAADGAETAKEPIGSMGNDTPLAVLSRARTDACTSTSTSCSRRLPTQRSIRFAKSLVMTLRDHAWVRLATPSTRFAGAMPPAFVCRDPFSPKKHWRKRGVDSRGRVFESTTLSLLYRGETSGPEGLARAPCGNFCAQSASRRD